MDSSIFAERVNKLSDNKNWSKFLRDWVPNDHTLNINEKLDKSDPNWIIAHTETWNHIQHFEDLKIPEKSPFGEVLKTPKKSLKKYHKKLDKQPLEDENGFRNELYSISPSRAGKEVFHHGEMQELHKEFEKTAVRRYVYKAGKGNKEQSVILRLATAKPVIWSNGKWQDIEVVDEKLHKRFKEMVNLDNRHSDWRIVE